MRYLIYILMASLLFSPVAYAKTAGEVKDKIKKIKRVKLTQEELDVTKNKSLHDLKGMTIISTGEYGQNFSFCDFKGATLVGEFDRCNFSYSINLDQATLEDGALVKSNLTFADLPTEPKRVKCNKARLEGKTSAELDEIDAKLDQFPQEEVI